MALMSTEQNNLSLCRISKSEYKAPESFGMHSTIDRSKHNTQRTYPSRGYAPRILLRLYPFFLRPYLPWTNEHAHVQPISKSGLSSWPGSGYECSKYWISGCHGAIALVRQGSRPWRENILCGRPKCYGGTFTKGNSSYKETASVMVVGLQRSDPLATT